MTNQRGSGRFHHQITRKYCQHQHTRVKGIQSEPYLKHQRQHKRRSADRGAKINPPRMVTLKLFTLSELSRIIGNGALIRCLTANHNAIPPAASNSKASARLTCCWLHSSRPITKQSIAAPIAMKPFTSKGCLAVVVVLGMTRHATTIASRPRGTLMKKIQCQLA